MEVILVIVLIMAGWGIRHTTKNAGPHIKSDNQKVNDSMRLHVNKSSKNRHRMGDHTGGGGTW